ncbi:MAG: helix-turn-helix transcriptional regulator [Chloroflexota bacterium]|nr:helix-turn-helix transcriptional regulator [Chloroflexota bacterium]
MGDRIRSAREAAHLSQADLASRIGMNQASVSRFESGREVGSITLSKIAEALDKRVDFFLGPVQPIHGVLFKKGGARVETLPEAARRMLDLVEDYETVRRLAGE